MGTLFRVMKNLEEMIIRVNEGTAVTLIALVPIARLLVMQLNIQIYKTVVLVT